MSKRKNSTVIVSPASREIAQGSRPIFVLGLQNGSKQPSEFRVVKVSVVQMQNGAPARPMPVVPYEKLVSEERTRQVVSALLVGAAAAGNSI